MGHAFLRKNPGHGAREVFRKKNPPLTLRCGPGTNPLIRFSIKEEDLERLKTVLKMEDVNTKIGGLRALDAAILSQNSKTMHFLIEYGADPLLKNDKNFMTSLELLFEMKEPFPIIQILEKNPEWIEVKLDADNTLLHKAAEMELEEVILYLLDKGVSPNQMNKFGQTSLHIAAKGQRVEALSILLRKNVDPNIKDYLGATPLSLAAHWGRPECVIFLIENGSNLESIHSALHEARMHGSPKIIEFLMNREHLFKNFHENPMESPLHHAAVKWTTDYVDYWLKEGTDPNKLDANQNAPLHLAALFGYEATVESLLKKGAFVNVQNKERNTPLHFAAACGHLGTLLMLYQGGAQLDVNNGDEESPFHWASPPPSSFFRPRSQAERPPNITRPPPTHIQETAGAWITRKEACWPSCSKLMRER